MRAVPTSRQLTHAHLFDQLYIFAFELGRSCSRLCELLSSCRRKVYDRTGSLADTEELSGEAADDLYSYYRTMFPKVTEDDIEKVISPVSVEGKEKKTAS